MGWVDMRGNPPDSFVRAWAPTGVLYVRRYVVQLRGMEGYYICHDKGERLVHSIEAGPFPTLDAAKAAYLILM